MDSPRFIFFSCLLVVPIIASVGANEQGNKTSIATPEEGLTPQKQVAPLSTERIIEPATATLESGKEPLSQKPEMEIIELPVDGEEVNGLLALHDEIEKEVLSAQTSSTPPQGTERLSRALVGSSSESSDALNDEDISKLIQLISFPSKASEKKSTAAKLTAKYMDNSDDSQEAKNIKVEPRALRPHGYYILAFAPINGPLVPTYTKLDIIPAERALDGDLAVKRANMHRNDNDPMISASEEDEARLISMKKLNRYVRRLMKQIRKGTRKIQRKTRFKSNTPEPTVENFLTKLYAQRDVQKKKNSWFSW